MLAASSLLLATTIIVLVFLAALPAYLDEYLLTNNDFCYPTIKKLPSLSTENDRYLYDNGINVHRRWSITNMILRQLASYLWSNDNDEVTIITDTSTNEACENNYDRNDNDQCYDYHLLHPFCAKYRKLRSQLHFRKLYIPWNWYYRRQSSSSLDILVIDTSLRSSSSPSLLSSTSCNTKDSTENENDTTSQSSWEWMMGWILIDGGWYDDAHLPVDENLSNKYQLLPPSFEIKSTNFSIRYPWTRPIISVQVSGITINIIVRRIFPPRSMNNKQVIDEEGSSSTCLIGDMTIREALMMLPRPPDEEGLYPRIGIVNITNATLCVYESSSSSSLSLKLLLKFRIPDDVFVPVTNMTLGERIPDNHHSYVALCCQI